LKQVAQELASRTPLISQVKNRLRVTASSDRPVLPAVAG
jgi:hypothetical protein